MRPVRTLNNQGNGQESLNQNVRLEGREKGLEVIRALVKENDNYQMDISQKRMLGTDVSSLGNLVNFAISGEESYFTG